MNWGDVLKILIIGAGIGVSWYKLNDKLNKVVRAIELETTSRMALKNYVEKWLTKIGKRYESRISKLENRVQQLEREFFDFIKKNFKKK